MDPSKYYHVVGPALVREIQNWWMRQRKSSYGHSFYVIYYVCYILWCNKSCVSNILDSQYYTSAWLYQDPNLNIIVPTYVLLIEHLAMCSDYQWFTVAYYWTRWCLSKWPTRYQHHSDVKMGAMASQITSISIVYSTVCSGADRRRHQSSASLAFVRGIHRWPVNSPHQGPVTRKMFPFNDVM